MSNALRISLAEWMFLMSDEDVPYQARTLAMYAAVFKLVGNDELAKFCGMDSQGKADHTFNRWKKVLYDGGWVLLENTKGGRGLALQVLPAYHETPVEFTDVSRKNPGKYNPRRNCERGAENTPVMTPERGALSAPTAKVTGVISTGVSRARVEDLTTTFYPKVSEVKRSEVRVSQPAKLVPDPRAELAGLNGATSTMLADIQGWMHNGDEQAARKWLASTTAVYGAAVLKDAYVKLTADLATGELIAAPLQTLTRIAQRMKAAKKPSVPSRWGNGS